MVEDTSPVKPAEEKTIEFSLDKAPVEKATQPAEAVEIKTKKLIALKLTSINPNPVSTSKQRQIISISGSGFNKRQKIKVSWTDKVKILSDTQVTLTSDSYINLSRYLESNRY